MSFTRIAVGGVLAVACLGVAWACGPNFPWQLLDDRDETVSQPVGLGFTFEASRLVDAPKSAGRAVEPINPIWYSGRSGGAEPEVVVAERNEAFSGVWRSLVPDAGSNPERLAAKLTAARGADDGAAAMALGAGLPPAVLDYIAGAVEFRADRFEAAARYFEAIDRLPPDQRRIREVAAAYMQGRIKQKWGELAAARAAFQAARRHAEAGAPDPMGLAVASLGEEARIDLAEAGVVKTPWWIADPDLDDAKIARLIANGVRLYAEQAALGSPMALLSLREVARLLVSKERELKLAVASPLVRRLLVAYVVARDGQSVWDDSLAGPEDAVVVGVIDAVLTQPAPAPGYDLDRLAALAYQAGRYELAEKLTAATNEPLGLWVRAKLALRRGDRAAAVRDWTAALTRADDTDVPPKLDNDAKTRLRGELAVAKLSQGAYPDSLRLLFPVASTYWGDVAYIAERVLTVDELKAFVDGLPPQPEPPPKQDDNDWGFRRQPVPQLRDLLARRLMRDGRMSDALAYFPQPATASSPSISSSGSPPVSPATDPASDDPVADEAIGLAARAYLAAVEGARPGRPFDWPWQRVSRAEAWFKAATLARKRGMDLMGTEGPPDEFVLGGSFADGVGQSSPNGISRSPSTLLGPDEASRFAASAPKPDKRFHYRTVATDHAVAAADLLPQRSQAYAAALCWAALYAADSSDQARVEAIYRRYVATGAYQAWANRFGRVCPQPDFESARTFWARRVTAWPGQIASLASRHVGPVAILAALLLAGVVWAGWARRKRPA